MNQYSIVYFDSDDEALDWLNNNNVKKEDIISFRESSGMRQTSLLMNLDQRLVKNLDERETMIKGQKEKDSMLAIGTVSVLAIIISFIQFVMI